MADRSKLVSVSNSSILRVIIRLISPSILSNDCGSARLTMVSSGIPFLLRVAQYNVADDFSSSRSITTVLPLIETIPKYFIPIKYHDGVTCILRLTNLSGLKRFFILAINALLMVSVGGPEQGGAWHDWSLAAVW